MIDREGGVKTEGGEVGDVVFSRMSVMYMLMLDGFMIYQFSKYKSVVS